MEKKSLRISGVKKIPAPKVFSKSDLKDPSMSLSGAIYGNWSACCMEAGTFSVESYISKFFGFLFGRAHDCHRKYLVHIRVPHGL